MFRASVLIAILYLLNCILHAEPVINEFMAAPINSEPEWIELYNPADSLIDISNYKIADAQTAKPIHQAKINAKSYCIITKDTCSLKLHRNIPASALLIQMSIPSLNNTDDEVKLFNKDGDLIDSLYYSLKSSNRGISLERQHYSKPANQGSNLLPSLSQDSASCGYLNSVSICDDKKDFSIDISPNPFSFKNGGVIKIEYKFDYANLVINSEIYNLQGNRIYKLANNMQFDYTVSFTWDGTDSIVNTTVAPGTYILLTKVLKSNGEITAYKDIIVVAY